MAMQVNVGQARCHGLRVLMVMMRIAGVVRVRMRVHDRIVSM